jgi:hypothetical protein
MALSILGMLGAGMVIMLLFVATMFFAVPLALAGTIFLVSFAVILACGALALVLGR